MSAIKDNDGSKLASQYKSLMKFVLRGSDFSCLGCGLSTRVDTSSTLHAVNSSLNGTPGTLPYLTPGGTRFRLAPSGNSLASQRKRGRRVE